MTEVQTNLRINGSSGSTMEKDTGSVRLWRRIQLNEWTFSLFLFVASLGIVLGKLCVNYGSILQLQNSAKYTIPSSISVFSNVPHILGARSALPTTSEKFVNVSSQYEEVVTSVITSFFVRCGWLIRAAISGLVMMGFTWFIIYKDSSIPGVNPPSPFSPSKQRLPQASRVQMNYLVGILNGILIFTYMCL